MAPRNNCGLKFESSTASCNNPAATTALPAPVVAKIKAVSTQCVRYRSPFRRNCTHPNTSQPLVKQSTREIYRCCKTSFNTMAIERGHLQPLQIQETTLNNCKREREGERERERNVNLQRRSRDTCM
jgi:hypothetical protein